jgi:hypothetical protein
MTIQMMAAPSTSDAVARVAGQRIDDTARSWKYE